MMHAFPIRFMMCMYASSLARQVEKLASLWHDGTLAGLLTRWHLKLRSCHTFGTLAWGHVGMETTQARVARDLSNSL